MEIENQPADLFLKQLTYMTFDEVRRLCSSSKPLYKYCTDPKYNLKWKNLIINTFGEIDHKKLEKLWKELDLKPETYNYIIYTQLVKELDLVTQYMIYWKQGDMINFEKYDSGVHNEAKALALFLLGDRKNLKLFNEKHENVYQDFVDFLNGVKLNKDKLGFMMMEFAWNKNLRGVKYMLNNGASVNYFNENLLRSSVDTDWIEGLKLALDNGANIHIYNDYPLREAATRGFIDVLKLLLERGTFTDEMKKVTISAAIYRGQLDAANLIKNTL